MIRWDEPGYVVAFTTRVGRRQRRRRTTSLNLTRGTGDDPAQRRGEPAARLRGARARPRSGSRSTGRCTRRPCIAPAGRAGEHGDGLWTEEPRRADARACPPTACRSRSRAPTARAGARRPARGLARARAKGSSRPASTALGAGPDGGDRRARRSGRAATRSGTEVSALFDDDLTAGRQARSVDGGRAGAARAPASSASSGSTLHARAIPSSSSRTVATAARAAVQGVIGAVA